MKNLITPMLFGDPSVDALLRAPVDRSNIYRIDKNNNPLNPRVVVGPMLFSDFMSISGNVPKGPDRSNIQKVNINDSRPKIVVGPPLAGSDVADDYSFD